MRSHHYITQIQPTCKVGNAHPSLYLLQMRSPNQKAENGGVFTTGETHVDPRFKTLAHPVWVSESAIGNHRVWFAGRVANDTGKSTDPD